MSYKGEIAGQEITVNFGWDKKARFRCELLDNKDFDSEEAIEQAIRRYDLALRKDFKNNIAYVRVGIYGDKPKIVEVKVTSVVDEKDAWITGKRDGREKIGRENLFASREEAEAALANEIQCDKNKHAAWKAVKRWEPKK